MSSAASSHPSAGRVHSNTAASFRFLRSVPRAPCCMTGTDVASSSTLNGTTNACCSSLIATFPPANCRKQCCSAVRSTLIGPNSTIRGPSEPAVNDIRILRSRASMSLPTASEHKYYAMANGMLPRFVIPMRVACRGRVRKQLLHFIFRCAAQPALLDCDACSSFSVSASR
jgi:hypothetical protein